MKQTDKYAFAITGNGSVEDITRHVKMFLKRLAIMEECNHNGSAIFQEKISADTKVISASASLVKTSK